MSWRTKGDRAIASEAQATREADLEALGRSRVTKVDLGRARGRAEVFTPGAPTQDIVEFIRSSVSDS